MFSTACTPKRRRIFLEAIAKGMSAGEAAKLIGVSRRTVYTWRSANPEVRTAWDDACDVCVDALEGKLFELAQGGDLGAIIFMLRSRRPEIYNPALVVRMEMLAIMKQKAFADAAVPAAGDAGETVHIYILTNGRDRPEEAVHAAPPPLMLEGEIVEGGDDEGADTDLPLRFNR